MENSRKRTKSGWYMSIIGGTGSMRSGLVSIGK